MELTSSWLSGAGANNNCMVDFGLSKEGIGENMARHVLDSSTHCIPFSKLSVVVHASLAGGLQ